MMSISEVYQARLYQEFKHFATIIRTLLKKHTTLPRNSFLVNGRMDGWMNGWMDGWREGGREGGMDEWNTLYLGKIPFKVMDTRYMEETRNK